MPSMMEPSASGHLTDLESWSTPELAKVLLQKKALVQQLRDERDRLLKPTDLQARISQLEDALAEVGQDFAQGTYKADTPLMRGLVQAIRDKDQRKREKHHHGQVPLSKQERLQRAKTHLGYRDAEMVLQKLDKEIARIDDKAFGHYEGAKAIETAPSPYMGQPGAFAEAYMYDSVNDTYIDKVREPRIREAILEQMALAGVEGIGAAPPVTLEAVEEMFEKPIARGSRPG